MVTCEHCGGSGAVVGAYSDFHEDQVECLESLRDQIRSLERRLVELEACQVAPQADETTTLEAVATALLLSDRQTERARDLLRGKAIRDRYLVYDVLDACRQVERASGLVYDQAA